MIRHDPHPFPLIRRLRISGSIKLPPCESQSETAGHRACSAV